MDKTDIISICLGITSVLLAFYSVWQSWRYKNIGDKINNENEQIINAIRDYSVYSAITIRHINEELSLPSNTVILHKDELYVFKNSKYKESNINEVVNKLKKELPRILKQTYIDSIIAKLKSSDGATSKVGVVTLRKQYEQKDLEIIKELNDIFYEDGLSFKIIIS